MNREYYPSYLVHYGVRGQRWGDRKYQNPDGSLTPEGRIRYGLGPGRNGGTNIAVPLGKRIATNSVVTSNKKPKFKFSDVSKERGNYIISEANKKHQDDSFQKQVNRARAKVVVKRFGGMLLPDIGAKAASRAINLAGMYATYKSNGKFMWDRRKQRIVDTSIGLISAIQNGYQVAKGVQEMRALNKVAPIKLKKNKNKKKNK